MSEEERQALLDERHMWQSLLEMEGFKRLMAIAQTQVDARKQERECMRVATQEDVAQYNFSHGEECGIRLFMRMAEIQVGLINDDLEKDHG